MGVPPRGLGRVGRGWEVLPESQERSRGPGEVGSPFWKARKGREGRERSVFPPGGPGRVGRPSRGGRRGWESLLEGWDVSGGPPFGLGRIGRPSQRSGSFQEGLPAGRQESGGLPQGRAGWGWTGGDRRSPQRAGRGGSYSRNAWMGWETLSQGCWEALLEGWEGSGGASGWLGVLKPSQNGREETSVPHRGREGS